MSELLARTCYARAANERLVAKMAKGARVFLSSQATGTVG